MLFAGGCKRRLLTLLLGVQFSAIFLIGIYYTQHRRDFNVRAESPSSFEATTTPPCSAPNTTTGPLTFHLDFELENWTRSFVERNNEEVHHGGWWAPTACKPVEKVLIVVPYRNREPHLTVLLGHLHPLLRQQLVSYHVFVVEQYGNATFNKGRLLNAAFLEATRLDSYDCVVFHDVDLMPEDDRIPYSCPRETRHLSVGVNTFKYQLPYPWLVGGVFAIRREHFVRTNGYPLGYWGWGGEDDDLAIRIKAEKLEIARPPAEIGRYQMAGHAKDKWNPMSVQLLDVAIHRYETDGLNTAGFYDLVSTHEEPLFTHLMVDVGLPPTPRP